MRVILSLLLLSVTSVCLSQSVIKGKVTDELGQPVAFAAVTVKDIAGLGCNTNLDGDYQLKLPDGNPHTLVVQYLGYENVEFEVAPSPGETLIRNVDLMPEAVEIGPAIVEAKARRSNDNYMEKMKQKAPVSMDYISQATIKRTGDSNVRDAVRRVPGVSTVGGFISVRGLADRYIKTTVNGSRVPTLDPFTNNIKLDIFPSGLIDNLIITKSETPDLPGDWSGAFLSIETKDYPDELVVEFSTSFGYNTQASLRNIVSSVRSSSDFWGFDNGYREIPDGVPVGQEIYPSPVTNPTYYQQFQALGLESFLNGYGITDQTNIEEGDIFYQVAMSELGLMGPAQFYDNQAINAAIAEYQSVYGPAFFEYFNRDLARYSQSFANNWFTIQRQAPLDMSNSITIGNEVTFLKRKLGFMVGLRRSNNTVFDPVSIIRRTNAVPEYVPTPEFPAPDADELLLDQQVSTEVYGWSGLLNLAYQLSPNCNIGFVVMPNFIGENRARKYQGRDGVTSPQETLYGEDQYYEERRQMIYEAKAEYLIPKSSTRIELHGAFTDGLRNVLDFRDMQYVYDALDSVYQVQTSFSPDRRYRYLNEDLLDTRLSVEHPLNEKTKLKLGLAYQRNERNSSQIMYSMQGVGGSIIQGAVENIFAPERFSIEGKQGFDLFYLNGSTFLDNDIGISQVSAAYAMTDAQVTPKLRVVGGLRLEQTDMIADIERYYQAGLDPNAEERVNIGGVKAKAGLVDTLNVLPSVNLIYTLSSGENRLSNLRINYFRSLARPSFRELSAVSLEDFEFRNRIQGNPSLKMTDVNNIDLRLENYYASGSNLSVSVFYKQFTNHIELLKVPGGIDFTWQNAEDSHVLGLEVEGKIPITDALDARGNVSLIYSETTVTVPVRETRPMFGQAPWIVNGMLSYSPDTLGWNLSASYNVQGPKIAVVANSGEAEPDIYELPRHMLDLNISKKFGKHYTLGFQVRNVFNAPLRRTYRFDAGWLLDFDRFVYGQNFVLNFSYAL